MKKLLLFTTTMALLASCASTKNKRHRVGELKCATSKKYQVSLRKVGNTTVKDSFLVSDDGKYSVLINYKPEEALYTGFGTVAIIDTHRHPYEYLIKVGGIVIKNGIDVIRAKYVVVYEANNKGTLFNELSPYVNTNQNVYFESSSFGIPEKEEIIYMVRGKVAKTEPITNNVIFTSYPVNNKGKQ